MDYQSLLTSLLTTIAFASLYAAWRGVQWLYSVAVYRRTISLTFQSFDTEAWNWLEHWIAKHANQQRPVQHLRVKLGTEVEMTSLPEPILFAFEGHSIRVRVNTYTPPGNISLQRQSHGKDEQTATLWTRGTDSTIFKRLLVAMKSQYDIYNAASTTIWSPYVSNGSYCGWNTDRCIPSRKLNTLTLPSAILDIALRELTMFLDEKETKMAFYAEHCIPFRRGWLLEGPPGNGKSSFIMAVAAHLRAPIYPVSLSQSDLDDTKLHKLMVGPPVGAPPHVFVLEDIDCLFENREAVVSAPNDVAPRRSNVTLSGLLNVLDGMGSPINVLIIMTTNYADRLDAALLRPGRVDTRFRVEPPSDAQIAMHYGKFFPDASRLDTDAFVLSCRQKYHSACSMAQVQALILAEHDKE